MTATAKHYYTVLFAGVTAADGRDNVPHYVVAKVHDGGRTEPVSRWYLSSLYAADVAKAHAARDGVQWYGYAG